MKIGKTNQPHFDRMAQAGRQNRISSEKASFAEFLKGQNGRMDQEHLTRLLQEIELQGQRLARSRTLRDLYQYKSLVKRFVEEAVKYGVAVDERKGNGRRGRSRVYRVIKQVDQKLLELTDAILEKEQSGIEILDRIGEIRGMLINLYF
ncbi:MAG: YaaR family protein [Bacillaceae bacterium]|nr:YaaR family protein [Bacillaceae bacterium]